MAALAPAPDRLLNRFLNCWLQGIDPPSGMWRCDRAADARMGDNQGHAPDMFAG